MSFLNETTVVSIADYLLVNNMKLIIHIFKKVLLSSECQKHNNLLIGSDYRPDKEK